MIELWKRLLDFVATVMIKQCTYKQIPTFAHQNFFQDNEQDTAVYAYGPYEDIEHHPEEVLVLKFMSDDGLKVFITWKGVSVMVESNLPIMGWDRDDGEFGLGGDWWKRR